MITLYANGHDMQLFTFYFLLFPFFRHNIFFVSK